MRNLLLASACLLLLAGCTSMPVAQVESSPVEPSPVEPVETPLPSVEAQPDEQLVIDPKDSGPQEGATGSATLDTNGEVVSYVVAAGDTAIQISGRFSVELDQLTDEAGTRLGNQPTLQIGDVIHFAPHLTGDGANCFYRLECEPGS